MGLISGHCMSLFPFGPVHIVASGHNMQVFRRGPLERVSIKSAAARVMLFRKEGGSGKNEVRSFKCVASNEVTKLK